MKRIFFIFFIQLLTIGNLLSQESIEYTVFKSLCDEIVNRIELLNMSPV